MVTILLEEIKKQAFKIGIKDFYNYIRNYYLEKNGFKRVKINEKKKKEIDELVSRTASVLGVSRENLWENPGFHMFFRITNIEQLKSLKIKIDLEKVKNSLAMGRELTILPLNVVLGEPTIYKFIPVLPELYSGKKRHSLDPYGLFRNQDQIRVINGGRSIYIGSRKFDYAVLANITEFCPVGCAECYKGTLTRLSMSALANIDPKYVEIKKQLNLKENRAIKQMKLLKRWLNKHPEVDTVIISGGEPLMYSPDTIGKILDELSEAKYLKAVRICTSSVYQGLFYKINDELIEKLRKFKKNNNGRNGKPKKHLYFNCHVTDEHQLLTPEARIATEKLQDAGISIYLQMPLQEGINFYRDNIIKSAEKLRRICEAAYEIGVIPYKAIVNMHSPSYKELTVPIEKVSEAISFLDEHFDTSDMVRWQAYNVLHEEGNFYIYPKPNFVAYKNIDKNKKRVIYFIPKIKPNGKIIVHTYEEPLIEGINDRNSLPKITDNKVLSRIKDVKEAYKKLKNNKINTKEFYMISGIRFSENKPLVIRGGRWKLNLL